ncbi:SDR family NAD(P)-dependent oxidoreductase [Pseudonocardia sp.]|jgi:NAD(P)-dependent dehydrogenase (short-subunit alcohol dehydrogenase family)|uniref:SDR family NAD(P)-dependent oxidoreductase n=1 Tax=Pseudonocardia sp. TaxID=60912 RepID=UPI00260E51D3|nr:SDR family NAD(P)-dependent oxidoreductase [Pseudonocardia sp.]MCW2716751.1 3-hydroxyacyl-CoA dehydrogenase [Pseudonocardia sp.]
MKLTTGSAIVTGGASGLGLATVRRLAAAGTPTVVLDLPTSDGVDIAKTVGEKTGTPVVFAPTDVTEPDAVDAALDAAEDLAPVRVLVHCAGRGGAVRLVDRDGLPGSLDLYETVVRVNLIGTFNVLRLVAVRMARTEPVGDERGVCVLTSSVAAWEGQVGQAPYASAKAGIVGLTLVAARDLAGRLIRVCTIAPGLFDTPILTRVPQQVRDSLGGSVPHPRRLGVPDEYASLALHIIENPMLNGETIRLDGAIRMPPR